MSDWQVGDLAPCIKLGPWVIRGTDIEVGDPLNPTTGSIHTVSKTVTSRGDVMLWFGGHGHGDFQYAFRSDRFVKITPPEADEFDRETLTLEQTA